MDALDILQRFALALSPNVTYSQSSQLHYQCLHSFRLYRAFLTFVVFLLISPLTPLYFQSGTPVRNQLANFSFNDGFIFFISSFVGLPKV